MIQKSKDARREYGQASENEQIDLDRALNWIDKETRESEPEVIEPENINDWEYIEENDGTISLIKYKGTETTVIIPNRINGKRVKKIDAPFGLWDATICSGNITYWGVQNTIKKVVISSGIEEITRKSFCCSKALEEIVLPNSIKTVGDYTFWNCENLKNITIPESVTTMGEFVFSEIPSITVNVPFKEGKEPDEWKENWNAEDTDGITKECAVTVNYAE